MRTGHTLLTPLALVVALAAAGCGAGASSAPSKAEYVKQADAVCRAATAKVTTAAAKAFRGGTPTLPQVRAYATHSFFPVIEQELKDLRALTPPDGDRARTTAIYDAVQAGVDRARGNPVLLGIAGARNPFTAANAKANAYGLTVCGAS
jgi:hypothetical protein